jgi:UV DNA damage endonuclease
MGSDNSYCIINIAKQRFRENYRTLPQDIKDRLVLENDEICYSVADLLPVCQELSIPLVLDWYV